MVAVAPAIENLTLTLTQEIHIRSSLSAAFAALLEQIGPAHETHDGRPLPMVIEPRPGGRWFRDLGDDNGHFWGHVQAIKRPTLLELTGPMFMSYPVVNNVQYRLAEVDGGTLITLRHTALGLIPDGAREGLAQHVEQQLGRIKRQAETS
jgi:uncharacterized protein YndB with AHSA1/START domain